MSEQLQRLSELMTQAESTLCGAEVSLECLSDIVGKIAIGYGILFFTDMLIEPYKLRIAEAYEQFTQRCQEAVDLRLIP